MRKRKQENEEVINGWKRVDVTLNLWTPCGKCGILPKEIFFRRTKEFKISHEFMCRKCTT